MKLNFPYQSNTSSIYYDQRITPIGKSIYGVIVNEVINCKNQPSQTLIASILNISVTSVKEHIKPLEEHGYITKYRVANGLPYIYGIISVDNGDEYIANRNLALKKAHELKEIKDSKKKDTTKSSPDPVKIVTQSDSDPVKKTTNDSDEVTQSESDPAYTESGDGSVLNCKEPVQEPVQEPLRSKEPIEQELDNSESESKSDSASFVSKNDTQESVDGCISVSEEDQFKELFSAEAEALITPRKDGLKVWDASQEIRKNVQRLAQSQSFVDMLRSNVVTENDMESCQH